MKIPYKGTTAFIHGIVPQLPEVLLLQLCNLVEHQVIAQPTQKLLDELSKLLSKFDMVFAPISALPPERSCDRSIPLIVGAKPVQIQDLDTLLL
jgi:hypothetical protein